jgi:hypothetical protein
MSGDNPERDYPPSGCGRCGHREYCHFLGRPLMPYHATGSHDYEPPTNQQIKERMLARRAARTRNDPRGDTMSETSITDDAIRDAAEEFITDTISNVSYQDVGEWMRRDPRFNELPQGDFDAAQTRVSDMLSERIVTIRWQTYAHPEPPTALDHATTNWHETNAAIGNAAGNGNPADPYRYAALLDARAGWWDRLGQLADQEAGQPEIRDVYAIACSYAAELDRQSAAETRFQHRIPTLHPGGDAARLGMTGTPGRTCRKCDRPWQIDRYDACPACPDLLWGITPHSAEQAASYPPGQPWTPHEPWTAGAPLDDEDGDW